MGRDAHNAGGTKLVERIDMNEPKPENRTQQIARKPNFAKRDGLLPVTVQEEGTGRVLMLVYTREEQYLETRQTKEAVFYSTSRQRRWKKGEESSGNVLRVTKILLDCDDDALIYTVVQTKPEAGACHTGAPSCFSTLWEA